MLIDFPFEDEVLPDDISPVAHRIGHQIVAASESLEPTQRLKFLRRCNGVLLAAELKLAGDLRAQGKL